MVRAPCCEKMGLKKGPWTPEEDRILIAYIQRYGHGNWRALPKQAGLLRCGKSCRLRWTNYLRPDIKRGNFTREEEETIIKLHELLGNRWSAIAARLPGRTDNEIKNVWHTHLKKRLHQNPLLPTRRPQLSSNAAASCLQHLDYLPNQQNMIFLENAASPPQRRPSSSDLSPASSSSSSCSNHNIGIKDEASMEFNGPNYRSLEDPSTCQQDFRAPADNPLVQFPFSSSDNESTDFWLNLLVETGSLLELPQI